LPEQLKCRPQILPQQLDFGCLPQHLRSHARVKVSERPHIHSDTEDMLKVVLDPAHMEQSGVLRGIDQQIEIAILPIFTASS
jgi:hypothetical protein